MLDPRIDLSCCAICFLTIETLNLLLSQPDNLDTYFRASHGLRNLKVLQVGIKPYMLEVIIVIYSPDIPALLGYLRSQNKVSKYNLDGDELPVVSLQFTTCHIDPGDLDSYGKFKG